jgi:DNA-binding transcriptional ArsR family regulator
VSTYDIGLDALGDPTRRKIVEILRRGALPVGRIAAQLPVSRPAVSQHLRVLERAGLVRHTTAGTRHVYEVDLAGLEDVREWLEGFWEEALDRFKHVAEHERSAG